MSIEALAFAKMTDLGAIEDAVMRLLYQEIAEAQYNDTRVCRLTQAEFARVLRRNVRSVRRYLDALEQHRFIVRRTKRGATSGNVLYDEIRLVGFTRWYRGHRKACGKSLADKMSGSGKPRGPTGQNVRQLPDTICPPATGQQESGTVEDYPTTLPTLSPLPPDPAQTPEEGSGDLKIGFAKGWTPAAISAVGEVRASVTRSAVAIVLIDGVCGVLNPPRDVDGAAYVRQLAARLGTLPVAVLAAVAEEMLATRARDLPAVVELEKSARRHAAVIAQPVAVASGTRTIRRNTPEWEAYMAAIGPERAQEYRSIDRLGVPASHLENALQRAARATEARS